MLVDTWLRRLEGNTTVGKKGEASTFPHHSVLQVQYCDKVLRDCLTSFSQ